MMLNGLQTSSKTLPLEAVSAKSQSVDSETSASVSFGSLLKLKEKQLQHEQETSASVVAAAFVTSQTSSFGTSLPITNTEVIEAAAEIVDLKTTNEALSGPAADPTEISGQLSVTQSQTALSGVAKSAAPTIPVDAVPVNENFSQQAFVATDRSELLPRPAHAKASTFTVSTASTLNLPIQLTDQASTAKEVNVTAETKKDSPSLPSNLEFGPVNVTTPSTERFSIPTVENQVPSATITMKASPSGTQAGITARPDVEGEVIKNAISTPHTASDLEVSPRLSTVDPIAPNIKTRESTASHTDPVSVTSMGTSEEESKRNATVPKVMDSITSETIPVQHSPVKVKIIQETSVSKSPIHENPTGIGLKQPDLPTSETPATVASIINGQPSNPPAPVISIFSSSAPAENEADVAGFPAGDPMLLVSKPQSANITSIDPVHVPGIPGNSSLEQPIDLSSHPGLDTLIDNISVQEQKFSVQLQQFASQADKIQSEESPVDADRAINTSSDQVTQPIYVSSPKNSFRSNMPPGYTDVPKSEQTGITGQAPILQDEVDVMNTSGYSVSQAEAKQFPDQEFASRADNFEPRIPSPITKREDEIGQTNNFSGFENPVDDANKVSREILHTTEMQPGEAADFVSSNPEKSASPQQMSESGTYKRNQIVGEQLTTTTPLEQAPVDIKESLPSTTSNSTQSFAETTFSQNLKEPGAARELLPVADPNDQINMLQNVVDTLTERDVLDTNAATKSRVLEAEATATKAHSIPGMKKIDLSGSAVSEGSPQNEAVFPRRFEPVVFETNGVVVNSSLSKPASSRFMDAAGIALPTSNPINDSPEAKTTNVHVAPRDSVTVEDRPETVEGISLVQAGQEIIDMSVAEDKTAEAASTRSMMNSVSAKPGMTSARTGTSLERSNEIEAPAQQVTTTQPHEDLLQPKITGTEKRRTKAFEAVEKQTNISNASGELPETGSRVSNSKVDVPAIANISKEKAGTNLQASPVVQASEAESHPDVTSTTQLSQPTATAKDPETYANALEQVTTESPELTVKDTDTSLEMVSKDMKPGSKQPNAGTIFGNTDDLVKLETIEQTDANVPAAKIVAPEKENNILQSSTMETSGTTHQPGLVASEAYSVNGNKFSSGPTGTTLPEIKNNITQDTRIDTSTVAENHSGNASEQPEAHVERLDLADLGIIGSRSSMFGDEANIPQVDTKVFLEIDLPKTTSDEDIKVQTERSAKMSEAISRASHDAGSQPALARAVEPGIMEAPVDQSANIVSEFVQGNKNESHIDVMSENFNNSFGIPKEHVNVGSSESMAESRRVIHPVPVMVESVSDQFMPVSSGPQNVEEPEVSENTKQTMTDKGASSVEEQPRMSQMPGIAMPANGPMNEPPAANPGGNIPSKQLQAGVAEIVQQMVHHIKPSLKNRPASMRMQLNPSDLGAIDVQLVSNARGVHVTFFAEQASTGKLLETQLDQLRNSLLDSGVHLSGLDIGQHGQSGQKGGSFEQSPNFSQDVSHNFPKAQPGIQENSGPKRSIRLSTEIDYLI